MSRSDLTKSIASADRTCAHAAEAKAGLDALVRLSLHASGATGIRITSSDGLILSETGDLRSPPVHVRLVHSDGSEIGTLALSGAVDAGGLPALVAPLVRVLLQADGYDARMKDMRSRVERLERELHHRTGNVLQTVASFLHMQAEDFEARIDATGDEARQLVEDARTRVVMMGAVHSALEVAVDPDGTVAADQALVSLCDRLEGALPDVVTFGTDLAPFHATRSQVCALGIMVAEFALSCTRDAFPKPRRNLVHVHTHAFTQNGREHVSMTVHHEAEGYDTSLWVDGAPALPSRIVETLATELDGLVAMDRMSGTHGEEAPGLRLRLLFDRPRSGPERARSRTVRAEPGALASTSAGTFDTRLGLEGAPAVQRKA